MEKIFHEFENGVKVRFLPINNESFIQGYNFYFVDKLQKFFILDTTSKIGFKESMFKNRLIRYFNIVEYNNKLYITKTGRTIKNKVIKYFTDDTGIYYYKTEYLLNNNVIFNPIINMVSGFKDYSPSNFYEDDLYSNYDATDLFNSIEYKELISNFSFYINNLRLENRPEIIKYLEDNDLFLGNYQYLLRGIKINEIRSKKINTTKLKLWNQVIKMVGETSDDNNRMEDIGYLKENDEEVHQFMVDGYLFEVKLVDDVK